MFRRKKTYIVEWQDVLGYRRLDMVRAKNATAAWEYIKEEHSISAYSLLSVRKVEEE